MRVAALGAALLLILLAVAQAALLTTTRLRDHQARTLDRDVASAVLLLNADRDLYQAQFALRQAAESDDPAAVRMALAGYRENREQVLRRFAAYLERAVGMAGEADVQRRFMAHRDRWLALGDTAVEQLGRGEKPDLAELGRLFEAAREQIDILEEDFYDGLVERKTRELDALAGASQTSVRTATAAGVLLAVAVTAVAIRLARRQERIVTDRIAEREAEARRRALEQRIHHALEMAQTEPDALEIVRLVAAEHLPGREIEVLLADSSRAHLERTLRIEGAPADHDCGLPRPFECPAVRCGHTLTFASSDAFDACPHLRRMGNSASATCVPLSVMGQTMGVVTVQAPEHEALPDADRATLEFVAKRLEDRLGVLRAFARSEAQASTDPLTGLLNRRSFESQATQLMERHVPFALAFGDIDRFKQLNDTHGHETGDRALRLLSRVMRENLRDADLAARWGGEEFLLLLPGLGSEAAAGVLERIRTALREETGLGRTPAFTISFGLGDRDDAGTLDALIHRVDASLLAAKRAGRDRIVCVGEDETPVAHAA